MQLSEELITILSDGRVHSGEALGVLLGISRVAVWKRLKKLEEFGLEVETIKGKGYCISGGVDLHEAAEIYSHCTDESRVFISNIDIFFQIDSTNSWLADKARDSCASGRVCLAEQQTAGRGRRGRAWHSPFGRNIYMSVGWNFSQGASALEGLSLAVGVALVRSLSSVGVENLALKWPNDVICNGKKLAGVLIEMSGDAAGPCSAVVGIGLNVDMGARNLREIGQPWIDVATALGRKVSRNQLVGSMLSELVPILTEYQRSGFARYQDEWNKLDHLAMQDVELVGAGDEVSGVGYGVDETGAFRVKTESGIQLIRGGEISLRRAK